jgi:RND family efflux transporter MFP subunit
MPEPLSAGWRRDDRRWACYGLAAVCVLAAALVGCGHENAPAAATPNQAELPLVRAAVLHIEPGPWPTIVRSQGSLVADEVTVVGAKVAGRVADVPVDLGDRVTAGSTLATLDQDEFRLEVALAEAQLLQARAALGLAPTDPVESLNPHHSPPVREAKAVVDEIKTRIERIRALRARNAVTQDELDQAISEEGIADARLAAAVNGVRERIALIGVRSAELSVAQQRLADTVARAPFDGLVQQRHVAPGTFVQVGQPVATLVRTTTLRFRGAIPERHSHRLQIGQHLTLRVASLPAPRLARITRISPTIEELTRALMFEAEVENADGALQTGQFAEAEVVIDPDAQTLVVPASAVIEFAGSEKVWKVVDGVAREQVIETARRTRESIEIAGGLAPGDVILADGDAGRVARIEPITNGTAAE